MNRRRSRASVNRSQAGIRSRRRRLGVVVPPRASDHPLHESSSEAQSAKTGSNPTAAHGFSAARLLRAAVFQGSQAVTSTAPPAVHTHIPSANRLRGHGTCGRPPPPFHPPAGAAPAPPVAELGVVRRLRSALRHFSPGCQKLAAAMTATIVTICVLLFWCAYAYLDKQVRLAHRMIPLANYGFFVVAPWSLGLLFGSVIFYDLEGQVFSPVWWGPSRWLALCALIAFSIICVGILVVRYGIARQHSKMKRGVAAGQLPMPSTHTGGCLASMAAVIGFVSSVLGIVSFYLDNLRR